MTFPFFNIIGILQRKKGQSPLYSIIYNQNWPQWKIWTYNFLIGTHLPHIVDFSVALIYYLFFFPIAMEQAHEIRLGWILQVVLFNIACEFLTFGLWHWFVYVKNYELLKKNKYDEESPYGDKIGFFTSSNGYLQREIFYTTLGWLQSTAYQCFIMHLWARGIIDYQKSFWDRPFFNFMSLYIVCYWRDFHFYWVHRAMHPWWKREYGLAQGDIGAFLYKHFHSLHHKSYNPGPWSGLSMHPVEHFLYYTCTLLPLIIPFHPLHFLYTKAHADIAPISGHDGFAYPGGDGAFHWLHHAKFECNYGSPTINYDKFFGTYVDYDEYIKDNPRENTEQSEKGAKISENKKESKKDK